MGNTPVEPSLELTLDGRVLFSSGLRWLHPLLELEEYLASRPVDVARCLLRDKIVGRAAALLMVRLGVRAVHAGLLSRLGEEIFLSRGVRYTSDGLVDRIACRTEDLLREVTDPEEAHRLIVARAAATRRSSPAASGGALSGDAAAGGAA